jgi:Nitroreductase family
LAGILTDEPLPRTRPLDWEPYVSVGGTLEMLDRPSPRTGRSFGDVLAARRSAVGKSVDWRAVAELLWYAAGLKGHAQAGRAGLPIGWSASPTSGGLQSVRIVCISDDGTAPKLYEPAEHAFVVLAADTKALQEENRAAVMSVTGIHRGCTLRLVGDRAKLLAAYENVDTLLLRDAGAVTATVCLCAEWLGLCACPLGFLGSAILPLVGLPTNRFRAVGGVQITRS